MKNAILKICYLFFLICVISCGNGHLKQLNTVQDFENVESEIKNKFGTNSYFTELSISYNKTQGNIINVTVTNNPESLTIEEWNNTEGNWIQSTEITFEAPRGSHPADFMFQLNKDINLKRMGQLIEKSKEKLKNQQKINNAVLDVTYVKFPKNGDLSKTEFIVKLKPENDTTIFSFSYPFI